MFVLKDSLGKTFKIEKTFAHPNYDNRSSYFDVGIIKTENIMFNENIRPICLPEIAETYYDIHKGKATQLLGKWALK